MATKFTALSSGMKRVLATDWRVPTQAAPTTVPAQKPASVAAFSNNDNSFTSTTLGKKILIAFPGTAIPANNQYVLNLRGTGTVGTFISLLTLKTAGLNGTFGGLIQVTPIIASWDPTIITWNTITGLTLGTPFNWHLQNADHSLTPNATAGDIIGSDTGFDVALTVQLTTAGSPITLYGVMIEVAPQNGIAAQSGQPETAQLTYGISTSTPPYLIVVK